MRHVLANLCCFGLIAGFSALSALNPDAYYLHVQEDQPLEWSTFWGFMVAGGFFLRAAYLERLKRPLPWFFLGVAAFCVVVAMEEISWGQRVLGYSPPRYFLEKNWQQEFNIHNVIPTRLRQQLVVGILATYGLLLPLMERIPRTRRLLSTLGITAPPAALAPIFAALIALLMTYPIEYSGELVEGGMALAFIFSAVAAASGAEETEGEPAGWPVFIGALSLVIMMGFGSALWSRGQLADDPVVAEVTATEIHALERDLRALSRTGTLPCGKHERLNWISKLSKSDRLATGRFNSLTTKGLPEERAEFFIDPWSTAYWVRTTCNQERDKVFLYSFGPNRRRDSSIWELGGDDIGVLFRLRKEKESPDAMAQRD